MGRIGIFGGTFDPPTKAHLVIAQAALENLTLDKIYFLIANRNPHKKNQQITPSDIRVEMVKSAISRKNEFGLELCELERQGISYTYDTLLYLKEKHQGAEMFFIQGADSLLSFPRWYKYDELLKLATFVFFPRVGWDIGEASENIVNNVIVYDKPNLDISSTEVRRKIHSGESVSEFVAEPVLNVIKKHNLYKN